MKKAFFLLVCMFIVISCGVSVCAEGDAAVYSFGDAIINAKPGEIVSMPVYLTFSKLPINAVQCDLQFDENVFEFQKYKSSTDKGDHKLSLGVVGVKVTDSSVVGTVFTSSDGNSTFEFNNTRLFTLRFKVKEDAVPGEYKFDVIGSNVVCNNLELEEYTSAAFSAEQFTVRVISKTIKGDLNGDGKITVTDALCVLKQIAGTELLTDDADINGDGEVTVTDSIAVLRYIARLTNEL